MKNINLFDEYTAQIFSILYQAFPEKTALDVLKISGHEGVSDDGAMEKPARICRSTIEWLSTAGYVDYESNFECGVFGAVLTAKGLEVLKAVSASLKSRESIGEKIVRTVTTGAKETAKSCAKTALTEGFKSFL